jgi:hypothetical protein
VEVPEFVTQAEHPKLHALLQGPPNAFYRVSVKETRMLRKTECAWVGYGWAQFCEAKDWEKYSVYDSGGRLLATNERGL